MINEGGLRAPVRSKLEINSKHFWDRSELDKEMRRQFDVCHSCRRCFNLCDSFPRLFDLIDDSSTLELDSVESTDFSKVVDSCTLCDMCFMVSCPYVPPHEFNIDIPSLFIRYRAIQHDDKQLNFLDKQIANTERNGRIATLIPNLANWFFSNKNKISRLILELLTGIDRAVTLPKFNKTKFTNILYKSIKTNSSNEVKKFTEKVILYSTCYVNYNDSKIGEAVVSVLKHNKVYIEENYSECCKMPQLEQGDIKSVRKTAIKVAKSLSNKIDQGYKVIAPVASCSLMIKSHWPLIASEIDEVIKLAKNTYDIDEYLWDLNKRKGLAEGMTSLNRNITLHSSCHSRAQNIGSKSAQVLGLIPDVKTINVEKCSGHGGTWGIKKKWNKIAKKVGAGAARLVFKDKDSYIASTCPLAGLHLNDIKQDKNYISHGSKIYHPIELLAMSYNIEKRD